MKKIRLNFGYWISSFFVIILPVVYGGYFTYLLFEGNFTQDYLKNKFGVMVFAYIAIVAFIISKYSIYWYNKCSKGWKEDLFLGLSTGSEYITLLSISIEIYSNDVSTSKTASILPIACVMVLGIFIITHLHKGKSSDAQAIKELAKTASETYVKFEKLKDEMDSIIKNNKSIAGLITEISKEINSNNNDLDRAANKINEILISCNKLMSDDKNIQ
ncbi:hypothetical protein ACK6S7_17365 [Proteus mirabilis]|uniref:hypothetical protein n=1 Tax=Proteus mirabilis TaxID=584 RepID=UPI0039B5D552